jgi:hypothetical protein
LVTEQVYYKNGRINYGLTSDRNGIYIFIGSDTGQTIQTDDYISKNCYKQPTQAYFYENGNYILKDIKKIDCKNCELKVECRKEYMLKDEGEESTKLLDNKYLEWQHLLDYMGYTDKNGNLVIETSLSSGNLEIELEEEENFNKKNSQIKSQILKDIRNNFTVVRFYIQSWIPPVE